MWKNAYSFKEFSKEFNPYQYGKHIIEVTVFDTSVLSQIESGLLSSLKTNQRLITENQNEVQNIDLSNKDFANIHKQNRLFTSCGTISHNIECRKQRQFWVQQSACLKNSRNAKEVQLVELKVKLMEELQANSRLRLRTDNIIEEITSLSDTVYRETSISKKSAGEVRGIGFFEFEFLYMPYCGLTNFYAQRLLTKVVRHNSFKYA